MAAYASEFSYSLDPLNQESIRTGKGYTDLYSAIGAILGTASSFLFELENGYLWDYANQEVIPGPIVVGDKPEFNRQSRRKLNQAARAAAKAAIKAEKEMWPLLYHYLTVYIDKNSVRFSKDNVLTAAPKDNQENQTEESVDKKPQSNQENSPTENMTHTLSQKIEQDTDEADGQYEHTAPDGMLDSTTPTHGYDHEEESPQANQETLSTENTAHTTGQENKQDTGENDGQCGQTTPDNMSESAIGDNQEEQSDASEGIDLDDETVKRMREILTKISPNGILRFIHWVIREIGNEMATDSELRKKYIVSEGAFTRERSILLSDVLLFLLTMAGDNMNNEVYEYFKMDRAHPSTAAMVERRGLLKAEGVEYFLGRITSLCLVICDNLPGQPDKDPVLSTFNRFLSGDGSGINVAYDPNNPETFVAGKEDTKGYNQYHLNSIRDFISGIFMANVLQPVNKLNETSAAVEMINSLDLEGRNLFTGDRGYASLNLIETIRRKENLDLLIRVKESWIKETRELPMEELDVLMTIHVVTTQRKIDKIRFKTGEAKYLPGISKLGKYKKCVSWGYESEVDVTFRVVRFQLDGGAWETLVTTLDAEEFSIEDLKKLYFMRWSNIENAFRTLKWDTHLSQMHCKLDNSSRQEIFARIAMHNIVSCVIRVANCLEPIIKKFKTVGTDQSDHKLKNPLIVNRRFATHLVCDFLKHPDAIKFDVIDLLLRYKVPVRSDRSYKRNMRVIGFISNWYR